MDFDKPTRGGCVKIATYKIKKPGIFILIAILLIVFSLVIIRLVKSNTIERVVDRIKVKPLDKRIIVIDPGHGGIDGGTNFGDILEKDINLEVGLRLRDLLIKKGAEVVMTREIDDSLDDHIVGNGSRHREDLNTRARIINESKADLFISIHVNYSKNEKKLGPIVFYHESSEEDKNLAEHMQMYLNDISSYKKHDIHIRHDVMKGNYYIAGNTDIPGIIIEIGFLSNEFDRKALLDPLHQEEIIEQITKGIIDYLHK